MYPEFWAVMFSFCILSSTLRANACATPTLMFEVNGANPYAFLAYLTAMFIRFMVLCANEASDHNILISGDLDSSCSIRLYNAFNNLVGNFLVALLLSKDSICVSDMPSGVKLGFD